MKKIYLILIGSFLLISASVVEINRMITQPAIPKQVKVLCNYISLSNERDLNSALNIYNKAGWVVKTSSFNSNGYYLIILEKY